MDKHLHIVSFNIPYPADYGGVIDVFYRIKALHAAGVKIHLHCFRYGREEAPVLNDLCEEVTYYKRSMSVFNQISLKPFIVKSRANRQLLRNLLKNNYPILFEGLHTCYYLAHPKLKERGKIVRCHNIEHHYYASLTRGIKSPTLSSYFRLEAFKLKKFEQVLAYANHIAAISEADEHYFQHHFGKTFLMRPCHPSEEIGIKPGKGDYLLYHGDLSTNENNEAVMFILDKIVPYIFHKVIIAGKNPSTEIKEKVAALPNVKIIPNPAHDQMQQLIADAHINLLPTFQATGFKLKLLNALYNGRFCLVTPEMVQGTGLEEACVIAHTESEFSEKIGTLMNEEFANDQIEKRTALLKTFSNSAVVSHLVDFL